MMSKLDQKSLSLVRAALGLKAGKEYGRAVDLLNQTLELEPNNIFALLTLGLTYQEMGKRDEAERAFRKALVIDPENSDVLHSLGLLLLAQNRLSEASICFRKQLENEPDNRAVLNVLIPVLVKENRLEEAEQILQRAWRHGKSPHIAIHYARLLISVGQVEKAQAFLQTASQTTETPSLLAELALTYAILDQYPQAAETLEKAIAIDPKYDRAYRGLAQCYTHLNKPEKALEFAEQAILLDPKHYRNWEAKADALYRLGRFDQAIEASQTGESLIRPEDEEARPVLEMLYLQQLSAYMQMGDIESGLRLSRKGRDKFPSREEFYVLEVQNLLSQDDVQGAISIIEQAEKSGISLERGMAPFYFQALHQAGQPTEALDFIKPLLRENKHKQLDELAGIGVTLYELGKFRSSQAVFEQLIQLDPDETRFAMNYAFILTGEGEWEQAENLLSQALAKRDPENTFIIKCNLGYLRLLQGRYAEANTLFADVLANAPQAEGAILRVAFWFDGKIVPDFAPHSMRSARFVTVARANLVAWALSQSETEPGENWAREIIAEEPENPVGYEVLGCVLRVQKKMQESVAVLRKALELAQHPAKRAMLESWLLNF
jgi:tetratricopeptide (TPR) repeat protein